MVLPLTKEHKKCLDDLKVYYGLDPYTDHVSVGSGHYYNWLKIKYGNDIIKECEEILNVR